LITHNTLRDIARKDSRGFGVVGAGSAGIPKYTDYNIAGLTNEGFRKNVVVSACIQMIATSAPEAPLKVYRETNDGEVEDPNHWLSRLMKKPNDAHSDFELWEWAHTYMQTGGTLYLELIREGNRPDGEVIEMYPLRPDRMRVIPGVDEYISAYEYQIEGQVITYESWEILRIAFPDPLDEFHGLSPLKRLARELDIDNEATDFTATFFENAAVPYGLLSSDANISEPEADRIRWRWQTWFRGAKRFMVAVLGKGMKYERMGLSFEEMEFESLRSYTESRLCTAFGINPLLVGSWVGLKHNNTKASYEEARESLWKETIVPVLKRLERKISSELLEDGYIARFDTSEVQALQEDENEKHKRVREDYKFGLISLNEARAQMGHDTVNGGDSLLESSEGEDESSNDDNSNDKNLKKKALRPIERKDAFRFGRQMMELYDKLEGPFKEDLRSFFRAKKREIVKITEKKDLTPQELRRIQNEVNAAVAAWKAELAALSVEHIRLMMLTGGSLAAKLLDREFDGTNLEVLKFLEDYVPKFTEKLTSTTRKDLQAVLLKAQLEGWSVPKLKDELKRVFNNYADNRVEMIARSEVVRSSNAGAKMSYKDGGITELEWMDTDDRRTCPFCRKLDGKRIGIDQFFLKVGETIEADNENGKTVRYKNTYENIQYPPIHPMCRCALLPVID
jgi:HK97 family phage portal protein